MACKCSAAAQVTGLAGNPFGKARRGSLIHVRAEYPPRLCAARTIQRGTCSARAEMIPASFSYFFIPYRVADR